MANSRENIRRADRVEGADRTYFAGANTAGGFFSFYPEIFDERSLLRLYVIKGGPGSGKSTLMRRFLRLASAAGLATEAYLCGSDPGSLDAAIARGEGGAVALIDATSPHAYDMRYPGAVGRLFDCGAFWDRAALGSHRAAIETLADAKSAAYERAYRYLAALGAVRRDLRRLGEDALDVRKMRAACRRFALGLKAAKGGAHGASALSGARRCANCFSMRGRAELDVAPEFVTVTVTDCAHTASAMMSVLADELAALGIGAVRFVDCVEPDVICALVVPSCELRVIRADGSAVGAAKNFNMMRFLRRDSLAATKGRRSFAAKCAASLAEGAEAALAEAGEAHFALEDIYVAAMDFDSLGAAADALIAEAVRCAQAAGDRR